MATNISGGSIWGVSISGPSPADFVDTVVTNPDGTALALGDGVTMTCTGSTSNSAGFQSGSYGGAAWRTVPTFTSDTCDFGGGDEDIPFDIRASTGTTTYVDYTGLGDVLPMPELRSQVHREDRDVVQLS